MPVTLNASSTAGLITTADTSTVLQFQSNGTTTATIDASGNFGLGVTPSAWNSDYRALDVSTYGNLYGRIATPNMGLTLNAYRNSGGSWIYKNTSAAARYEQDSGFHIWYNAASGTAGNAITFTQAMTLDASGNLGVGTTSPSVPLHVSKGTAGQEVARFNNAGGFGLRIIPQVGGSGAVTALRVAGGESMSFETDNLERARIDSSGRLLVGTTSYLGGGGITLEASASAPLIYQNGSASTNAAASTYQLFSSGAAAYRFYVGYGGTIFATSTVISAISDIRYKENVRDLNVGLAEVMALKPRLYDWKEGKGSDIKNARGFIAQEFEEVFPDLIDEWKDPAPEGEEPYKSVRQDLIPVLVKAIQEQQALITQLQADVAALKGAQA